MIIATAQMCMKKLRILVMHLVKHIELVRKSKTNMAKKKCQNDKINSNLDRNFGSTPPEIYCKYAANLKEIHVLEYDFNKVA